MRATGRTRVAPMGRSYNVACRRVNFITSRW